MQQFVVPQFIDVEDKVLGPITVRQFIIVIAGGGILFVEYKLADFTLFLFEGIITLLLTLLIAFVKVNGRPVHFFILNFLQTVKRPSLRIWNKMLTSAELKGKIIEEDDVILETIQSKKIIGSSKLAELALVVDTGGVYRGDDEEIIKID